MMPISVLPHHDVSLDLIIFLKIIKLLKYETALVSCRHFLYIVLETLKEARVLQNLLALSLDTAAAVSPGTCRPIHRNLQWCLCRIS